MGPLGALACFELGEGLGLYCSGFAVCGGVHITDTLSVGRNGTPGGAPSKKKNNRAAFFAAPPLPWTVRAERVPLSTTDLAGPDLTALEGVLSAMACLRQP